MHGRRLAPFLRDGLSGPVSPVGPNRYHLRLSHPRTRIARRFAARTNMIDTRIETGIRLDRTDPAAVARSFRRLLRDGARLLPAGEARGEPTLLLASRYVPRFRFTLFDVTYYVTGPRFDDHLGFFVGYVVLNGEDRPRRIYPRIFYKDLSLMWRVATHYVETEDDYWIGKGDVRWTRVGDDEILHSAEETTNLPLEIQGVFDRVRRARTPRRDEDAIALVLRRGPANRMKPYADFTGPREAAARQGRINSGRRVARFSRRNDPTSLRFAKGFEPDLRRGVIEITRSVSGLYGGTVRKYRVLSHNRLIQYSFMSGGRHVWLNPPQTLTTDISSYGVRTADVIADDDLFVPGYEYHYLDETFDPARLHSQIPEGFAGGPSPVDAFRADASSWIEALPIVREFRRVVLGRR